MARSLRIEYPGAWYHVTCRVSKGDVDSHSVLHLTAGQRIFGIAPCADRPVSICHVLYIISWGGEPTNPLSFGATRNENRFMRCRNHVPTPTDSKKGRGREGGLRPNFRQCSRFQPATAKHPPRGVLCLESCHTPSASTGARISLLAPPPQGSLTAGKVVGYGTA